MTDLLVCRETNVQQGTIIQRRVQQWETLQLSYSKEYQSVMEGVIKQNFDDPFVLVNQFAAEKRRNSARTKRNHFNS